MQLGIQVNSATSIDQCRTSFVGYQNYVIWGTIPHTVAIKVGVLDMWTSSFKGDAGDSFIVEENQREKAGEVFTRSFRLQVKP